ncbi:hypothetical protein PCANC_15722 [Puccinia coronata f. sp. avenae]|uniref:Uncharacterized protein n=1 Tax=Puccinia coronata f. sp. avenae TaxID=200324 RepID=A0A2N5SMY5_9BASI|nr:hypothetical protein PCANC_15722 [Puccinia coronata f. sp. avenae]
MTTPCLTVVLPSLRRRHYQHEPLGHGSLSGAQPALVERYQPVEQVALLDQSPGRQAEQECLTIPPVKQARLTGTLVEQTCSAGEPSDPSSKATCSTGWYRSTRAG